MTDITPASVVTVPVYTTGNYGFAGWSVLRNGHVIAERMSPAGAEKTAALLNAHANEQDRQWHIKRHGALERDAIVRKTSEFWEWGSRNLHSWSTPTTRAAAEAAYRESIKEAPRG